MAGWRYLKLCASITSLPVCLYLLVATMLTRRDSQGLQPAADFKAHNSTEKEPELLQIDAEASIRTDFSARESTEEVTEPSGLNSQLGSQEATDFGAPDATQTTAEHSPPKVHPSALNSAQRLAEHAAPESHRRSQAANFANLSSTQKNGGEHSALKSYMERARKFCADHSDRGSRAEKLPTSGDGAERFSGSVMVQIKPSGGFGNGILFLENAVMVAWLTRRPIVFISNQQHLLRSPYLPDEAYVKNSDVLKLFAYPHTNDEKEAYSILHEGRKGPNPKLHARYKAKFRISGSGKEVWVDPLQNVSAWGLPLDGRNRALLVQSVLAPDVWTERSVHFSHDLGRASKVRERVLQLNPDLGHVHKCALHYAFGWPGPVLLRLLKDPLTYISNSQVLVAIHVRMGDAYMQKETHGGTPHKSAHSDSRMSYGKLENYFSKVSKFLEALRLKVKPRQVVVFIASDTEKTVHIAREHLSKQVTVFTTAGKPVHTGAEMFASREDHHAEEVDGRAKAIADWYMLALSNILLSPTRSTFSITASHLGMQHMAVLGNSVNSDHIEKMNRMSINNLL